MVHFLNIRLNSSYARLVVRFLMVGALSFPGSSAIAGGSTSDSAHGMIGFRHDTEQAERAMEAEFDARLNPADLNDWMLRMSSAPNHVGSRHNEENAKFMLDKFKQWGWNAYIETFYVLYPTPKHEVVEMIAPMQYRATLTEGPIPGDRTSIQVADELPSYNIYGADGDAVGDVVYVNYGMPGDYKTLERNNIDVKGKVVLARYGGGWRGLKAKLAQEHGAIGALIYSDPADDGYGSNDIYPQGPARPPQGFQRGSVLDIPVRPGDPLTPNIGATKDAKRLSRDEAETLLRIPVLPISYADAQPMLAAMTGPVVPPGWRGGLPITYHMGAGPARVHLAVQSDWSLKPLYDVVATICGSEYPDEWILRGNHHDGWVFGASDPLSGTVAMMAEAQAIGKLVRNGWKPKRTLVYLSWDGEEPGLLGSTEWAEKHADELIKKGAIYINSDSNVRGLFEAAGSHSLQYFVNQIAADLTDPETGATVLERMRAKTEIEAFEHYGKDAGREGFGINQENDDVPLGALGSGSDFTPFLQHLGIASINTSFGGEGNSIGAYHSAYDSYDNYVRFGDPGFVYGVLFARANGRMVLRAADADVLPRRFGDFADTMGHYVNELHTLIDAERRHDETLLRLLKADAFRNAANPTKPMTAPGVETPVPAIEFAPLDNALGKLKKSAVAYDNAYASIEFLPTARFAKLNSLLTTIDRALNHPRGLPGRSWYHNLIYAPGLFTGYGVKTLPGIREAIEGRRWDEAKQYIGYTAAAFEAYAAQIDRAAALMKRPAPLAKR